MKKLLALAVVILGFTAVSFGQVSATATASATIITPISITNVPTDVLDFGTIAKGASDGTVTIAPVSAGTRSFSNVTLSAINIGRAAKFTVTGDGSSHFTVTVPKDGDVTIASGVNKMNVKQFLSTPSGATGVLSSGTAEVWVGATLEVLATTVPGTYSGPFTVTVNYN